MGPAAHCLVDTNVVVRHLVQDHPAHARAATRLFAQADHGEVILLLLDPVLAEVVFVLESFYRLDRSRISTVLDALLASSGVSTLPTGTPADALLRYAQSDLHFADCVLAATAAARSLPIATFDRALLASPGVRPWRWRG